MVVVLLEFLSNMAHALLASLSLLKCAQKGVKLQKINVRTGR